MEILRLFDILPYIEETYPDQDVTIAGKQNGEWRKYSIQEYRSLTDKVSYALIKLGIQPKDKIAIISTNRPEWNILDMAIMQVGAIVVPIYPTISENDYEFILNHCEAKLAIVEGHEVMTKINNILPKVPSLKMVYTFIDRKQFPYLEQLYQLGEENPNPEELEKRKQAIDSRL